MLRENSHKIERVLRIFDQLIILLSWYFSYILRFEFIPEAQMGLGQSYLVLGVIICIISLYIYEKYEIYRSYRLKSILFEISLVSKANLTVFIIMIFMLYFLYPDKISRIHLIIFFTLSQVFIILTRIIKAKMLRDLRIRGKNLRFVKVLGDGSQVIVFKKMISSLKGSGIVIVEEAEEVDAFVLGFKSENQSEMKIFLKDHYNDVREIHILPELSYSLLGHKIEDFDGLPIITLNQPKFSTIELILKRLIDFMASTIGILIISPLLIIISILVKLSSPGPIFYGQERVGLDGKKFKMWKFRSMRMATLNEDKTVWTSKGDPRITKIGAFIRKTSIDELPQLFNILFGDMSLVGPRPERTEFVERFKNEIPNYMLRHKMKAGLTGWAQVNGWRGDTDLVARIECDIYYIKNWSIWLDIKIILLTFIKGFVNKNAY